MSTKTIGLGVALIVLGIGVTVLSDSDSFTSWIPAIIGLVFLLLGVVAAVRDDLRRHIMHAAALVALIAIIASVGSLVSRFDTEDGWWAEISQIATVVLCGGFLLAAVGSFRSARTAGKDAEDAARNAAIG